MNNFTEWFNKHRTEIFWFIIGWLTMAGLNEIKRGDGIGALIDFSLAYLNYRLVTRS